MFKVTFFNQSVKRFKGELQKAYARGDLRSVRRLSVLIMIGEMKSMETIRASWDISEPTVYHWLKEFVVAGWKSLVYGKMPGRPARLSKNAKAPVVGLDQSRAGSVRLSDRLLDKCLDPGSDL